MIQPQRIHLFWLALSSIILITLSCELGSVVRPRVENHPPPTLSVDTQIFQQFDCRDGCPPDSPPRKLGCDQLRDPVELLGGLDPAYPINLCLQVENSMEESEDGNYLYSEGCLLRQHVQYIIWRADEFHLIETLADLQAVYAPIETENEALSYALAATGLGVRYGLETQRDHRYFLDSLEDTNVNPTEEGYRVLLYDYQLCGCGPHTTYAVYILVGTDGSIEELSRKPAYENPAEDDLCVD